MRSTPDDPVLSASDQDKKHWVIRKTFIELPKSKENFSDEGQRSMSDGEGLPVARSTNSKSLDARGKQARIAEFKRWHQSWSNSSSNSTSSSCSSGYEMAEDFLKYMATTASLGSSSNPQADFRAMLHARSQEPPAEFDEPVVMSVGSTLHAQGQCRPCHYVHAKEGCSNGVNCEFCHFPHAKRNRPRPCKGKRDRYKDMIAEAQKGLDEDRHGAADKVKQLADRNPFFHSKLRDQLAIIEKECATQEQDGQASSASQIESEWQHQSQPDSSGSQLDSSRRNPTRISL